VNHVIPAFCVFLLSATHPCFVISVEVQDPASLKLSTAIATSATTHSCLQACCHIGASDYAILPSIEQAKQSAFWAALTFLVSNMTDVIALAGLKFIASPGEREEDGVREITATACVYSKHRSPNGTGAGKWPPQHVLVNAEHRPWRPLAAARLHALSEPIDRLRQVSRTIKVHKHKRSGDRPRSGKHTKTLKVPAVPGCSSCMNPSKSASTTQSEPSSSESGTARAPLIRPRSGPRRPSRLDDGAPPPPDPTSVNAPTNSRIRKSFSLLIDTGKSRTLHAVDLTSVSTDRELFALIWKCYSDVQKDGWFSFLLKPQQVHFVRVSHSEGDLLHRPRIQCFSRANLSESASSRPRL
jgi:hypothetical protein